MTGSVEAAALAAMPGPFYVSDSTGRIVSANPAFAALVGRTVDQIVGERAAELLPPHLATTALAPDWDLSAVGMTVTRDVEFTTRRGTLRHWRVTTSPVRDEHGEPTALATWAVDVTEHVRGRLTAEREAAFLRQVFDLVPNLLYAKDRGGRFTLVNEAMAQLHGTTPESLIGRAEPSAGGAAQVGVARRDQQVLEDGQEILTPEEPRRDARQVPRWFRTTRHPLRSPDGSTEQMVGVATDITEYRNAQQARLQLNEERMESIGRLAGGIAHDFNNLLMVLRTGAEIIAEAHHEDPDIVQVSQDISFASQRATQLTQHLLAYSRRQLLAPQPLVLDQVIEEAAGVLRRLLGAEVELRLELERSLPPVLVDRASMEQIIVNFASNARDAMPDGGSFTLRTRVLEGRLPGAQRDGIVELSAADTGEGIPVERVDHIFEPFYTTKPEGKGTGLGLSTVYGIVRQSGGTIAVDSTVGQGACFTVRLPATEAPPPAAESAPSPSTPEPSSSESEQPRSILIVDDEPAIRRIVGRVLKRAGYRALVADGAQLAMSLAEQHRGEIDMMLLDVVMPDIDGFQLATMLRALLPGVPVLHMTGHTKETLPCDSGELEREFLHKPFTPAKLLDRVAQTLAGW